MAFSMIVIAVLTILTCFPPATCSYLDYPRINFAGQFRVDTNAINNERCNFLVNEQLSGIYAEPTMHNYGSNSFQFYGANVTSVVFKDGRSSGEDPIVGKRIVNNVDSPFAKLVDLDVDCQHHSTIYGMDFGIQGDEDLILYGNWTPAVIAQNIETHIGCFSNQDCNVKYGGSEIYSAQSTTTLTNLDWKLEASPFMQEFKEAFGDSGKRELAVRITQYAFRYDGVYAELGQVVGVIGIPSDEDTLNVPGNRIMKATKNHPLGLAYRLCEHCTRTDVEPPELNTGTTVWMQSAPFKVNEEKNRIHIDLSNSFTLDSNLEIPNMGILQFGVLYESESTEYVWLIGEPLTYEHYGTSYLRTFSAIFDVELINDPEILISENRLVLVQIAHTDDSSNEHVAISPRNHMHSPSLESSDEVATILLKEAPYYVRPKGYYVGRFDQTNEYPNPNLQKVYITKYGKPATDVAPSATFLETNPEDSTVQTLPPNGVTAELKKYAKGIAEFEYKPVIELSGMRDYGGPVSQCTDYTQLPIDGQVYFFQYQLKLTTNQDSISEDDIGNPTRTVFLSHSTVEYTRPYTWTKDVEPILSLYAHITPIMKTIVDLSDYSDVTRHANIVLLKKALRLPFSDASYMPTTRNLSPAKRAMILEWLDYPLYTDSCNPPSNIIKKFHREDIFQGRCGKNKKLSFDEYPYKKDAKLLEPYMVAKAAPGDSNGKLCLESILELRSSSGGVILPERPLFGLENDANHVTCSKDSVTKQLQTALKLEWATIPPYLTTLYSIPDGCNSEIYHLIRSVVKQEMLHFALVGNMLIALGEKPLIDDKNFAPSYPGPLPGCVAPELKVELKRLSLKHIHDNFMVLELPTKTEVDGNLEAHEMTIGSFYNETSKCLKGLKESNIEIFDKSTEKYQVKWADWGSTSEVGNLIPILDTASALEAIDTIVSQGEGAGLMDPMDIDDATLAHFFKFEEIYCQHHLAKKDNHYSYTGSPIPFDPKGVFNMRDNPTSEGIPFPSICHTESRIFHLAYRNFLRHLQETFKGKPSESNANPTDDQAANPTEGFFKAVQLMEALQLNAKRLMRISIDPTNPHSETCGPIWDYEWKKKTN